MATCARASESPPVDVETACGIAIVVASALDHAHRRQILHRDIKPANLLSSLDGVVKVVDFGIAKVLEGQSSETAVGMFVGTVDYIAPSRSVVTS